MEAMTANRWKRQRRNALIVLYLAFVLLGALDGFTMGPLAEKVRPDFALRVQLLTGCLLSLSFMWYCTADARLVGKPLIQLAKLGIFFGWPVGVPIYLLWARGVKGLGVLLLHSFLLFLATAIAVLVSAFLIYGHLPG